MRHIVVEVISKNCLLRESLARLLNRRLNARVCSVEDITSNALLRSDSADVSILLVDAGIAQLSALKLVREALRGSTNCKAVLFAMPLDQSLLLETLRCGVTGYLLQDASGTEMVDAVRLVARGEVVCPPALCRILFQLLAQSAVSHEVRSRKRVGLTRRELQLLPLIEQGLTNKEIAAKLFLSEFTVRNHVNHILRKTGAGNRLAIIDFCEAQGLRYRYLSMTADQAG